MKIFIITMDDPVQTNDFIKKIINKRKNDIVGLAIAKGGRLSIKKSHSKINYLISLLLIMGPWHFIKNSVKTILFKIRKKLSCINLSHNPSILAYAKKIGIKTFSIKTPNDSKFLQEIADIHPDIIIHQSQNILKKDILSIPLIGTLNRHNALLPINRGRLTPFWVLFKGEKETGVSIHFVNEGIDSGDIIVQEKYHVLPSDNFNSLVKKNYEIAPNAMLRALDLLENGLDHFIPNNDNESTYNGIPRLRDAFIYRKKRLYK